MPKANQNAEEHRPLKTCLHGILREFDMVRSGRPCGQSSGVDVAGTAARGADCRGIGYEATARPPVFVYRETHHHPPAERPLISNGAP